MEMGFYHIVHFWLREGLSDAERAAFVEAVKALRASPNVRAIRVATPAGTPRAVVDNSWDVQLLAVFDDAAAHDRYQTPADAVHQHFVDNFKSAWTRVLIYDSIQA